MIRLAREALSSTIQAQRPTVAGSLGPVRDRGEFVKLTSKAWHMMSLSRALLAACAVLALSLPASARARRPRAVAPAPRSPAQARRLVAEGIRQTQARQYSTAIAGLEKAVKMDDSSAEAFARLGDAYYKRAYEGKSTAGADKDDAQSAVDAFRTSLALDPAGRSITDLYGVHHALAQCYDVLGRRDDALAVLKVAAFESPKNPMPNLYAASLRMRMGDTALAAANFETSVKRAYRVQKVPELARLVRSDSSFSDLLSLPANQATLRAYEGAAGGTMSEAQAEERSRSARAATGTDQPAETGMRDAVASRSAQLRDSIKGQAAAQRADPRTAGDPEVYQILDKANNAFAAQRMAEAANYYRATLEADSKRGSLDEVQRSLVLERLGTAYRQQGATTEAARVLEGAVEQMPQNASAHYQLALCYATDGQLAKSLTSLNKALDAAPTKADLRKFMLLARTDSELEGARDLPKFDEILRAHTGKSSSR
ncbi:MAG TPA: tetratricopeptide repeat protein [Elusimicrobiota bacterium]|nr:tetratricopeptide repeat protein [Elusimicrobiota bacterium]